MQTNTNEIILSLNQEANQGEIYTVFKDPNDTTFH